MTTYLLDANVLIALTVAEHEHHDRVVEWFAGIDRFAICPITEGALIRFLVRIGESSATAQQVVRALGEHQLAIFIADDLSYAQVGLRHVRGHRQVTDAYLGALAQHHHCVLATLDEGLAQEFPASVASV